MYGSVQSVLFGGVRFGGVISLLHASAILIQTTDNKPTLPLPLIKSPASAGLPGA